MDNFSGESNDISVKREVARLWEFFGKIEEGKRGIAKRLVENSAFMAVTLASLQAQINENGITERYQNGESQHGIKKSAAVDVYNTMIKNFTAVNKQLADLLPKGEDSSDELMQWLKGIRD
jgi:hypothetical protein